MAPPHERRDSNRVRSRSRSRSPYRSNSHHTHRDRDEERGVSHRHHHHRHHHGSSSGLKPKRTSPPAPTVPVVLPLRASHLSKHDLAEYKPLFASYLDIQKQIDFEELTEDEIKGRWKSFMGKWYFITLTALPQNTPQGINKDKHADLLRNRGELAEGWYDPITKQKAIASASEPLESEHPTRGSQPSKGQRSQHTSAGSDDEDDAFGPSLPNPTHQSRPSGPTAPSFQDLALRHDLATEDAQSSRKLFHETIKHDRREQRERLDELAPRAEPGTKERQLEKKREDAAAARTFRDAKGGAGEMEDVGEKELLGDAGGVDEVRRMKKEMERKKNEREVRREEILRARAVEREERLQVHREKEDKTMEMLKAIARERFG